MAYTENTYFKLRSRLDAFQAMALNYCLNAPSDEEAQRRIEYILNNLPTAEMKTNLKATAQTANLGEGGGPICPPECPYYCNGECLPYPCPTK